MIKVLKNGQYVDISAIKARYGNEYKDISKIYDNVGNIVFQKYKAPVFGFRIDKNNYNPDTRVEYLYDAVGMTPAYMDYTTKKFNYGSWGDIWFIKENRPVAIKVDGTVLYELNHSDFTKKIDGTPSYIKSQSNLVNFMSEIPLVYIKRWEDNNYNYITISESPIDESYKAYAHTNVNGVVQSKIYLPMFKGSKHTTNNGNYILSIAGQFPEYNLDLSSELIAIHRGHSSSFQAWQPWDWSKHELIADLLTLISKSTNSKSKFGGGITDTYSSTLTYKGKKPTGGYCSTGEDLTTFVANSKGQFYGTNDKKHHVTTFYIEDFWGNRLDRCLGLNLENGIYKIKMIPPYSASADNTYTTISDFSFPSSGWLKNISTGGYGGLPLTTNASATTGYCNYFYGSASGDYLAHFGGGSNQTTYAGSRFIALTVSSTTTGQNIGASPCFTPL